MSRVRVKVRVLNVEGNMLRVKCRILHAEGENITNKYYIKFQLTASDKEIAKYMCLLCSIVI
jgi:predicted thioesterase